MEVLQILFIMGFILGICQGWDKLVPSPILQTKEPDIYFIITDFHQNNK